MSMSYVRRVGKELYDTNDQPFRLRGVGIGGWLLLEGYMVQSYQEIDRPRRFHEHLTKMVGAEFTQYFFEKWYRLFFTEQDINLIKQAGFNSIRIPLDYQFLYTPSEDSIELEHILHHFEILDTVIALCKKHKLYIVLDMHAAPGGQTGTNIDNSKNNQPVLFIRELYQEQLCYIWKDLALRYKDEPFIAAFDLLNEPLPEWFNIYNHKLVPLYKKVIAAIRSVNNNHMITLEGLHWSTDWSCFTDRLDDNLLLQFHKYWSNPDQESIQKYLDIRETLNVPIFMGEGGENNLEWYYSVFKMYDQLDISFNFWTYKKMENTNSILSFQKPLKWDAFLTGNLSPKESLKTLQELLTNVTYRKSSINSSCINHILQQNQLTIPAFGYDYYGEGTSYHSTVKRNNPLRRGDNLHFVDEKGRTISPNFKQYNGESYQQDDRIYLELQKEEWVQYTYYSNKDTIPHVFIFSSNNHNLVTTITTKTHSVQHNKNIIKISATDIVQIQYIKIQ